MEHSTPSTILTTALKLPGVKVDREAFLRKELKLYYTEEQVNLSVKHNPAYAKIPKNAIDNIAKQVINYETKRVSTLSFLAGIPGGAAMAATIPADIVQYFGFMMRAMQKLAYLYGFDDLEVSEDHLSDASMNQLLSFLGVMFGVQEANILVKKFADIVAKQLPKKLAQKALTEGAIYPIIKKIATSIGIKMTKQIFADGVGKIVPIAGGVISGGISYISFKPSCYKLKKSFEALDLCDPEFYSLARPD